MDVVYHAEPGPWLPAQSGRTIYWYDGPELFEAEIEGKPVLVIAISKDAGKDHVIGFIAFNTSDDIPLIQDMKADRIPVATAMSAPETELYEMSYHDGDLIGRRVHRELSQDILPDESVFYSMLISEDF